MWVPFPSAMVCVMFTSQQLGGSYGHVSAVVAAQHKKLRFIVQDLPSVVDAARTHISEVAPDPEIASRITFMSQDFFEPQQVKDADVYLFRHVLHNWSDKYVVQALRNIVPAMKKNARILIMDHVLPEPNTVPKVEEKMQR
jgi:hypothetical protein